MAGAIALCRMMVVLRAIAGNDVHATRHAWCCLRDAGEKAGMRKVLKKRPWGNPKDALGGGKEAVGSDVLEVRGRCVGIDGFCCCGFAVL